MSQGYPTFHLQPTKEPSSLFIFRPCDECLECQAFSCYVGIQT